MTIHALRMLPVSRQIGDSDLDYRQALFVALDYLFAEHDDARDRQDSACQAEIVEDIRSVCSLLDCSRELPPQSFQ